MNIQEAKNKLEDARIKLFDVRDDLSGIAKDVEGVPPELAAEIQSTSDHVNRALRQVIEMGEGLASL